jgi:hypothetical protein
VFPAFLEACDAQGVRFLVTHPLTEERAATVIGRRRWRWVPALTAEGTAEREVGEVAEVTPYGDLDGWAGKA